MFLPFEHTYAPLPCPECGIDLYLDQLRWKFGDDANMTIKYPVWSPQVKEEIGVGEVLVGLGGGSEISVCCSMCGTVLGTETYIHTNTREYRMDSIAQWKWVIAERN